jgi:hypothetical protein
MRLGALSAPQISEVPGGGVKFTIFDSTYTLTRSPGPARRRSTSASASATAT